MITVLVVVAAFALVLEALVVIKRKSKVNELTPSDLVNEEVETVSEMDAPAPIELVASIQEQELRTTAVESSKSKKAPKVKDAVKKEKPASAPKQEKRTVELKKAAK
jgi:hypothetical protein